MTKKVIVKQSIFKSWSPLFNDPPGGDMNEYRQYIFDHVSYVKVMHILKLRPEECSVGKHSHRMVCPFKFHKNGRERTGSFRFSEQDKTFICFGCNEHGNLLKFLTLYCGGCEQYNLKKLSGMAGLLEDTSAWIAESIVEQDAEIVIKEANYKLLFDSGLAIRDYLRSIKNKEIYSNECEWADRMFIKIDKCFNTIEYDNIDDAKKILENIINSISKRKLENKL